MGLKSVGSVSALDQKKSQEPLGTHIMLEPPNMACQLHSVMTAW